MENEKTQQISFLTPLQIKGAEKILNWNSHMVHTTNTYRIRYTEADIYIIYIFPPNIKQAIMVPQIIVITFFKIRKSPKWNSNSKIWSSRNGIWKYFLESATHLRLFCNFKLFSFKIEFLQIRTNINIFSAPIFRLIYSFSLFLCFLCISDRLLRKES